MPFVLKGYLVTGALILSNTMEQNKDKNKTKTLGKEENEGKKNPKQ